MDESLKVYEDFVNSIEDDDVLKDGGFDLSKVPLPVYLQFLSNPEHPLFVSSLLVYGLGAKKFAQLKATEFPHILSDALNQIRSLGIDNSLASLDIEDD